MHEMTIQRDAIEQMRAETLAKGTVQTLDELIYTNEYNSTAVLAGTVHSRGETADVLFDSPDGQSTLGYFACKVVCVDPNASELFFRNQKGLQRATIMVSRLTYQPPIDNYAHTVRREIVHRLLDYDTLTLDELVRQPPTPDVSAASLLPKLQPSISKTVPQVIRQEGIDIETATFYRTLDNHAFMEVLAVEQPFNDEQIPRLANWFTQS